MVEDRKSTIVPVEYSAKGKLLTLATARDIPGVDYCRYARTPRQAGLMPSDHQAACLPCLRQLMVFEAGFFGWKPWERERGERSLMRMSSKFGRHTAAGITRSSRGFYALLAEDKELERLYATVLAVDYGLVAQEENREFNLRIRHLGSINQLPMVYFTKEYKHDNVIRFPFR